jgi:hypothetical protein
MDVRMNEKDIPWGWVAKPRMFATSVQYIAVEIVYNLV